MGLAAAPEPPAAATPTSEPTVADTPPPAAEAAPAPAANGPEYLATPPGGSRSYFMVSRETAFQREQLACARLGFDPTQAPFGDCAADLRAAMARASEEHKPVLIDFGASWCGACKELDEKTFPDPRVTAEGARFVALHVDATDDDDPEVGRVRKKYGVTEGLPVVLLFGSDGAEAFRFTEFVPPERLAGALAQVR